MARDAPILTTAVDVPTGRPVEDALRSPAMVTRVRGQGAWSGCLAFRRHLVVSVAGVSGPTQALVIQFPTS